MNMEIYANSCTGSSGINGDMYYISEDKKVIILTDGASGAGKDGKVLMEKVCVDIAKQFDYLSSNLDAKDYVQYLLLKINSRLIEISQEYNKLVFGTVDIVVLDNNILTVTTIGDSPVYYYDGEEVKRVAKHPRKYEWMIGQGYITKEQYDRYINQMHPMMFSCFDIFIPTIVPNNVIEQITLKENDIVVMCCDGLSDWINENEIFELLSKEGIKIGLIS